MLSRFPLTSRFRRPAALIGLLVMAALAGAGVDRWMHRSGAMRAALDEDGIRIKSGPWGDVYVTPFEISAPDEALPVRTLEAKGTHWIFPRKTEDEVRGLLASTGLKEADLSTLTTAPVLTEGAEGIDIEPPFSFLVSLPANVRRQLYQMVAEIPENRTKITFIHKDTVDERFGKSGLSSETLSLFHKLCCEHGDYLVFSGMGALLAQLPAYDEKLRFVKALTRQKTMLFRLHVGPDSDLTALTEYWAKGTYAMDVKTILQSVAAIKGGAWIDIGMLLPPQPAGELYLYPVVSDNPLEGQPIIRDCHWTSFNFFREKPDPNFSEPGHILQLLRENYYPAAGDPHYGDLVLLTKPDGSAVHSAIYIADNIVFTKNGSTVAYPWMLSTVEDLLKQYTFQVPDGQKLNVNYFRSYTM